MGRLGRRRARGGDPEARDLKRHCCGWRRSCAIRAWLTRSRTGEQTTSATGVATGDVVAAGGAQLREIEGTGGADGWKETEGDRDGSRLDLSANGVTYFFGSDETRLVGRVTPSHSSYQ